MHNPLKNLRLYGLGSAYYHNWFDDNLHILVIHLHNYLWYDIGYNPVYHDQELMGKNRG